jgi:hypothetical protein
MPATDLPTSTNTAATSDAAVAVAVTVTASAIATVTRAASTISAFANANVATPTAHPNRKSPMRPPPRRLLEYRPGDRVLSHPLSSGRYR